MLSTIDGFFLPFKGLRLILRPGLRRFVIVPFFANLLIFAALAYLSAHYFGAYMDQWLPDGGWLEFLRPVLWLLFAVAYALALFFGFTLIANLIAAPFNGMLAAKVEEMLSGQAPSDADESLLKAIGPAISGEIGKIVYFITRALPILILMVIPGINVLASLAWLLFGFWFLTIEYADYPMGNHALKPKQQRATLRGKRLKSLAFGAGVTTLMLIPLVQFAAMPAAVAAATKFWVDDLQQSAG